jgi:hypothetical protein
LTITSLGVTGTVATAARGTRNCWRIRRSSSSEIGSHGAGYALINVRLVQEFLGQHGDLPEAACGAEGSVIRKSTYTEVSLASHWTLRSERPVLTAVSRVKAI